MKKTSYASPSIKSEPLQVGVFGKYGQIFEKPQVLAFPRKRKTR